MTEHKNSKQHWWQKIKSLFVRSLDTEILLNLPVPIKQTDDPMLHLDELTALVNKIRNELDLDTTKQWDLDILAASTYLYQVDRILMKVRENMVTYRYRIEQFKNDREVMSQNEFIFAEDAHNHCYIALLNLTAVLKKVRLKQIYNDNVIVAIHALELESANLNSAIRAVNQLSFRHETLQQLNALEKSLMKTLSAPPPDFVYTHQGVMYSTTELLRKQLKDVINPDDVKWLNAFINNHDMLKKCYVVARKNVITELLDNMNGHIQELLNAFGRNDRDQEMIFDHLTAIFNGIDSVRFNSHRENGCSKNLFEKAKAARKELRKACQQHPIGRAYLLRIEMKREPLKVKSKSSL